MSSENKSLAELDSKEKTSDKLLSSTGDAKLDSEMSNGHGATNNKFFDDDEEKRSEGADGSSGGRETWSGRLDFIMSALSFAVGNGNLWRFPYLCYKNGGGAFLIPYIIMVMLVGIPLVFLEMSLGQYSHLGIVPVWRICPLFEGIGWAMFVISIVLAVYYNLLISYCFRYFFASFAVDLPWRTCGNWWNTEDCFSFDDAQNSKACNATGGLYVNRTCVNASSLDLWIDTNVTRRRVNPSDEYFHRNVLEITDSVEHLGAVKWQIALCLLLCWLVIAVCLAKGIKLSGKLTYITAVVPYILLAIMCIKGLTLDGAMNGISYYITPDWSILLRGKVWIDAAVQVAFSLSICWGGTIHLSSHNKFNNNCLRDAVIIAVGDTIISIFAGVVIFAFIGYMAEVMNEDITNVATTGAGLAFIVYAQAVTTLPLSQVWSAVFMLVLINIGIGTMFTVVQTIQMTLIDVFPHTLSKGNRPMFTLWALCIVMFLSALVMCTQGGMYVLQLLDAYGATYANLVLIVLLCVIVAWVYGVRRYLSKVKEMIGKSLWLPWMGVCWAVITPTVVLTVFIASLVDFSRTSYGTHVFPKYVDGIGWMIAGGEVLLVLMVAVYRIATTEGGVHKLLQPVEPWSSKGERQGEVHLYYVVPLDNIKNKEVDLS